MQEPSVYTIISSSSWDGIPLGRGCLVASMFFILSGSTKILKHSARSFFSVTDGLNLMPGESSSVSSFSSVSVCWVFPFLGLVRVRSSWFGGLIGFNLGVIQPKHLCASIQPMILTDFHDWWPKRRWESPDTHGPADVSRDQRFFHYSWAGRCRLGAEMSLRKWHLKQCSTMKINDCKCRMMLNEARIYVRNCVVGSMRHWTIVIRSATYAYMLWVCVYCLWHLHWILWNQSGWT